MGRRLQVGLGVLEAVKLDNPNEFGADGLSVLKADEARRSLEFAVNWRPARLDDSLGLERVANFGTYHTSFYTGYGAVYTLCF